MWLRKRLLDEAAGLGKTACPVKGVRVDTNPNTSVYNAEILDGDIAVAPLLLLALQKLYLQEENNPIADHADLAGAKSSLVCLSPRFGSGILDEESAKAHTKKERGMFT